MSYINFINISVKLMDNQWTLKSFDTSLLKLLRYGKRKITRESKPILLIKDRAMITGLSSTTLS